MKENNTNRFLKTVLYEDNHLIIINKRPSEIVQGDKTGDETMLTRVKQYIKEKYDKKGEVYLGLVHRLDRPVSGVVIFARTSKALSRMNKIFKERAIEKKYRAVVKNKPPDVKGELSHYLLKNSKQNKSYASANEKPNSKIAILNYEVVGQSDSFYMLEISLKTGRHHQIRTQLSAVGCPIKGDLKYGYPRSNKDASICLHAYSVSFLHPVKNQLINVKAAPPANDAWLFFENA